jgi:MoaA/NifB/PqqE/SkfB family radical SAM enzyme
MCDIWKANAVKREIADADLARHAGDISALGVERVMLTGGEPLLHTNLWRLCDRLAEAGVRITLVTTGLLIERHAADVARAIDEVVVSLDGPADIHDRIRRVPGGFARVARGLAALRHGASRPALLARCVLQKANADAVAETIDAIGAAGVDSLSFLAADVSSPAFNRPSPWDETRRNEVALSHADLPRLAAAIDAAETRCSAAFASGFVVGGAPRLRRLHQYYGALLNVAPFPTVRCNAPWVSAVLEPGDVLRPCFFHSAYPPAPGLAATLNAPQAISFRRDLNVATNDTCRRCVCPLKIED